MDFAMDEMRERVVGDFRVLQSIGVGSGNQGTVYKAVCVQGGGLVQVGTVVALKIMPLNGDAEASMERLRQKTELLAQLDHPSVVKYLGCFVDKGAFVDSCVIVQEFLEGETLKERLSRFPGGLDVDEALRTMDDVLSALDYTASRGIVHRDLKPGNIFLCNSGAVKLIDFELARDDSSGTTSSSNNLLGSFDYMAPDFVDQSFSGDVKSDVFSMGVVLHEMLAGVTPYLPMHEDDKKADFAFFSRWSEDAPSPIRISSRIGRLLSRADVVLGRALSRERARRYDDFNSFRKGLADIRLRSLRNGPNTYLLLQFIGKGGFGEVFKARHRETGRLVAVKHLLKAAYAARFCREARIMSQLNDPCFVRLVDFFFASAGGEKEAFIVMNFLDGMPGSSLRNAIKSAGEMGLPPDEVLRAFRRYAHGLSVMHSRGIYHRDIKPSNLYYPAGKPEMAAIMDLGIARDVNGTATHGQIPGTLDYMPPEVVMSNNRGGSGMDIYALGLCLYEAITGKAGYPRLPSGSEGYVAFFARANACTPPSFSDRRVAGNHALLSLLEDMTNPDVNARLQSAAVVVSRIDSLLALRGGLGAGRKPAIRQDVSSARAKTRHAVAPEPNLVGSARSSQYGIARQGRGTSTKRSIPVVQRAHNSDAGNIRRHSVRPVRVPPLMVFVSLGFMAVVLAAWLGYVVFGDALKAKWAKHGLTAVLASYRQGNDSVAEKMETDWLARWSPAGYGWCRLGVGEFVSFTNRLELAKAAIRSELAARAFELARAEERRVCGEKIAACRRTDGSLDEANYAKLDGWTLPQWLEGDSAISLRLPGIGRCVADSINAKISIEPPETRRARLAEAYRLLKNTWTPRLISKTQLQKLSASVDAVSAWCVGVVKNASSDAIRIDDAEVGPGGSRTIMIKDGHPELRLITRAGYHPLPLPHDLDGRVFSVGDEAFSPMPVKVEIPLLERGVSCTIDGNRYNALEKVDIVPGVHKCVYSKPNCKDQTAEFSVYVNIPASVPEPGAWEWTDEYLAMRKKAMANKQQFLTAPVDVSVPRLEPGVVCLINGVERSCGVVKLKPGEYRFRYEKAGFEPQEGRFSIKAGDPFRLPDPDKWETLAAAAARKERDGRAGLQEMVRRKCEALWANEPVVGRQRRLQEAGVIVAKAVVDGILTDDEAKPLFANINMRKKWCVGKVENRCKVPVVVGGEPISAEATRLIVFEGGIPEKWRAVAEGYEVKELLRDFDERTIVLAESDFVPLDVIVDVPVTPADVTCHFEGSEISGTIRLKPGSYICQYRRRGYEKQTVCFHVEPGRRASIPPPGEWKANMQR